MILFVFSSQIQQVFYVYDPKAEPWNTVVRVSLRDNFDMDVELSARSYDAIVEHCGVFFCSEW